MSRLFYHTMQDNLGNLLFGVLGTMCIAGTGTVATIYGDEALTIILPNPMTNHATFGSFKCFLPVGDYDFYMTKAGYTFEALTGVQGYGTLAQQDASAVAITGGTITVSAISATPPTGDDKVAYWSSMMAAGGVNRYALQMNGDAKNYLGGPLELHATASVLERVGNGEIGLYSQLLSAGGTNRYFIYAAGDAPSILNGHLQVGSQPALFVQANTGKVGVGNFVGATAAALCVHHARNTNVGLWLQPTDTDVGGNNTVQFANVAATGVGSITCTATTTSYNTTSDARLKHAVDDLTGELAAIQALRPVAFRWNSDDSPGVGFLAHEVAAHMQGVITGDEGAVNPDGTIVPQMIDYSKLVPFLVGAVKTLTARIAVLEDALGV